ncbi:N-alpha-acetyltransferase 20 [Pseudogymnoascus australis]
MTSIRPFEAMDVFNFNTTNLDPLTETYGLDFYFTYLARWPHLFNVAESHDGAIDGYIMGKLESSPAYLRHSPHALPWHAHITALTIAPPPGASHAGDEADAYFVDLYVRKSNEIAIGLYKGLGYSVFRRVLDYYSDDATPGAEEGKGEDAYDMRKPLKRDKDRKHVRENGENFEVHPEDVW